MGGMLGGKAGLTYCHMGTAASRLDPLRDALAAAPGLPRRAAGCPHRPPPLPPPRLSARHAVCCVQKVSLFNRPSFAAGLCLLYPAALRRPVWSAG